MMSHDAHEALRQQRDIKINKYPHHYTLLIVFLKENPHHFICEFDPKSIKKLLQKWQKILRAVQKRYNGDICFIDVV